MSNKIYDLFGDDATIDDIKKYAEAQFSVITGLNKQIEQLKSEKKHLEDLLKQSSAPISVNVSDDPEEIRICKEQLSLLNGVSQSRELTIEETRKVEIYAKILLQTKDTNKKKASPVDKMSPQELLKLVKDPDESSKVN